MVDILINLTILIILDSFIFAPIVLIRHLQSDFRIFVLQHGHELLHPYLCLVSLLDPLSEFAPPSVELMLNQHRVLIDGLLNFLFLPRLQIEMLR